MRHEEIIKRPDGTKYKISVNLDTHMLDACIFLSVSVCLPKKRTFKDVCNKDSYFYRELSMPQREAKRLVDYLEVVSKEEINAVLKVLVDKIYEDCKIN